MLKTFVLEFNLPQELTAALDLVLNRDDAVGQEYLNAGYSEARRKYFAIVIMEMMEKE